MYWVNRLIAAMQVMSTGTVWSIFQKNLLRQINGPHLSGEGKRVSLMPVADNRFYFFFDVPLPVGLKMTVAQYKALFKEYFKGWCEPVQKLIDAVDEQKTNRVEIHDIEPFADSIKVVW